MPTIYIDTGVHKELKNAAHVHERKIGELTQELIVAGLAAMNKKPQKRTQDRKKP